jgi:NADP-dependent 3-hydroxy acid dehydrogenase YdfG
MSKKKGATADPSEETTALKAITLNVVITGASSGIGAALARQMAREGHKVVLAARREGKLRAVERECKGRGTVVVTDVTVRKQVERLRDKAIDAMGHIDVWVNNAGRGIGRKVQDLTDAELDEMMSINVKGALYGMQAVLPHYLERKAGHIINVSTVLARVPVASSRSAYSASAAALATLTANLRMDLNAQYPDIHVSLVLPGHVGETGFADAVLGSKLAPPGKLPVQSAEEIADIIEGIIEYPRAEVYTSPVLRGLLRQYQADLESFEVAMSPGALPAPDTSGLVERLKTKG